MNGNHSISDVSRIAGIPKDLLRMWERRYDYPKPERDINGDRVYSDDQLNKLILIRQLVDQGCRPGKLMGLEQTELAVLLKSPHAELDFDRLIELLRADNAPELHDWLAQQIQSLGLRAFIHQLMVPANRIVGEAWNSGELAVYEEHLYTEMVTGLVRQSLAEIPGGHKSPRIMLTTLPGEQHSLGLLMVEALLRLGGAEVIPFGIEMPFRDIIDAAQTHNVDVIGLSFSSNFKLDDAIVMLSGLRQMVEKETSIWVGGSAFQADTQLPEGIALLEDLFALERAMATWKQRI
ncbi:MAG: cobalamin B12-binding domain-containing protein [Candidatus Thiodiazotropha sp.]